MEREEAETAEEAKLDPPQLLNLAETHLRLRNFSLSRQYSLELLSSQPSRRSFRAAATQVLTVSDILSATSTTNSTVNHYSVLQLDSFSTDHNLIRSHYKKLLFILEPFVSSTPLAKEALDSAHTAFACLSDPVKKAVFDTELRDGIIGKGGASEGFWTFCPYCFYVYEYDRVFEGCCLRCQNLGCRRVFHGVSITSLPKMELDKGRYFGCFGYFPLGFSPAKEGDEEMGKFESWTPIVGMFPAKRRKAPAGRMNMDDDDDNDCHVNGNGNGNGNGVFDGTNFIEILDDSDGSDVVGDEGEGLDGNMPSGVPIVDRDRPRGMRRKSVAVNARRKRKSSEGDGAVNGSGERLILEEDAGLVEEFVLENDRAVGVGGGGIVDDLNEGDMSFFEEDGELFVDLGANNAL